MAANDFAAQNGTEKLSTNALTTVNGVNVVADLIEVQRVKAGFGPDGALIDVTDTTPMPIKILNNSLVSTGNSSTAALILSGAFTGTSEDVSDYSHVTVSVFASHASATDGLQLQQSSDGAFWDFVDSYTVPATTGKAFSAAVQAKFFRVVYTNGGIMQTAFRLQTIFSKQDKKPSSVRPQDGRANDNDFIEVLSYLMAWNGASWDRLKATLGVLNVLQPDVTATGTLTAAAQTVVLALNGNSAASVQISGTWVGTITFEASNDGTVWSGINGVFSASSTPKPTATINGMYRLTPGGIQQIRVIMTSFTSGSAVIAMRASAATGGTFANQILPVNTDPKRIISFRGRATTFKTPGRATVSQKILSIHNATASAVMVDVNRIRVDMLSTVVKAVTVVTPIIRVVRYTTVQTNGTVLTKGAVDTSLTSNASVTVTGDASADGTLSATTLTLTPTQTLAQAYAPRILSAVGYEPMDTIVFFEGETDITLRPLEGLAVFLDNAVVTTGIPATDFYTASVDWTEYTAV